MVVINESIAACVKTKTTTNKMKTTNNDCGGIWRNFKKGLGVVEGNTNLHTVDNGGYRSSLDYQCQEFLRSLKTRISETG